MDLETLDFQMKPNKFPVSNIFQCLKVLNLIQIHCQEVSNVLKISFTGRVDIGRLKGVSQV